MFTPKSIAIFILTLAGAEIALLLDSSLSGFQAIDFVMGLKMAALAVTQSLAFLTLSPKEEPLGSK